MSWFRKRGYSQKEARDLALKPIPENQNKYLKRQREGKPKRPHSDGSTPERQQKSLPVIITTPSGKVSKQLDNVTLVELSKAERSLHTRHEQIAKAVRGCSKHVAAHTSNTNNNEVFSLSDQQTPDVRHKPSENSLPLPTTPPDQLETGNTTQLT
ncbi:hypothetical protein J6590_054102 [Homalodisca vitripennis]|nr:hypothetical protein J6590_054102 [Homalodisca vitripennis]